MKFGNSVLLEIVDLVREGFLTGKDISQSLRDIDVTEDVQGVLSLSEEYLKTHPRGGDWGNTGETK